MCIRDSYRLAGGWYAHQVAAMRAARGEALNDDVCLGDELVHFTVPIGERIGSGLSRTGGGAPIRSPRCVPLAVKRSTTMSVSAMSWSTSLCQSGSGLGVGYPGPGVV